MSKELYINGNQIDLDEKESPIALNYAVNNLYEIKDRQAYTSNIFRLPPTQNNRKALGFPDSSNIISEIPYRKNTGNLVQNGITIVGEGKAIIVGSDNNISVQLLSGIIGFFEAIGDKMLSDLDLSPYNHIWNVATAIASQTNTEGFLYPVIDYGALTNLSSSSGSINVDYLRPATFVHTLVKTIINQAGFSYEGDIFSDPFFLSEIIPFTNDKFSHGRAYDLITANSKAKAKKSSIQSFSYSGPRSAANVAAVISFEQDLEDTGNHWNGTEYTATQTLSLVVSALITTNGYLTPASTVYMNYVIEKFSSGSWTELTTVTISTAGSSGNFNSENLLLEATVNLIAGNKIRIVQKIQSVIFAVQTGNISASSSVNFTISKEQIILGQSVELEATLPPISQKDFIKDFLQRKGLTIAQDRLKNNMIFFDMSRVENNKSIAKDWTSKFINAPKSVSYTFGNYGRRNFAYFKKDDAVSEELGSGYFDLDNENLKPEVELFTSVFAASERVTKLVDVQVISIKKIPDPTTSTAFTRSTQPRILINRTVSSTYKFSAFDTGGTPAPIISLPYFNVEGVDGLGFENVFRKHYEAFIRTMSRPFIVKRKAIINEADISQLDWQIPIFDSETSEYYYLNEINDYIEGEVSEVGLIKLF